MQIVLRAAGDEDAGRIAKLLNTCTLAYQGIERTSASDARGLLYEHGSDPAVDTRLALDGDEVVGFARVWVATEDEVRLLARTHPEATGNGVGTALLAFCEARARELTPVGPLDRQLTCTSWARDERGPALLEGRGYEPVRYFLQMTIEAGELPAEGNWPADVVVERFSEGTIGDEELYEAWRDGFTGHWGHLDDAATFWRERRDTPREVFPFDPSLWLVAVRSGSVAGFALCEQNLSDPRQLGRVGEIAVVPAHRGAGLGYALLTRAFHELRNRGAARIVLDVDAENVTSALRLYRKAGMTEHPSFTIWSRPVLTPSC
jgi:mycothiol synthase